MAIIALAREVSASIDKCELSFHARQPIDLSKAIVQHQVYQNCLRKLGAEVVSLPDAPELPDAVFVEDTALVLDEVAIIMNMGAPSRRAEVNSVALALAAFRPLQFMTAPGTMDGGDVLSIERKIFVGLSRRTNLPGIEQLRALLAPCGYEVQAVEVRGCLHLKSACSYIGKNTILLNRSCIDSGALDGFELLDVLEDEPSAANALLLGETVVMPASFPKTRALLEDRGFHVETVDVSELQKAEAGVTCGSLIFGAADVRAI